MKPDIGKLDVFPSIWGRKCFKVQFGCLFANCPSVTDWAGGPGDSKDDVEWLDRQLATFFSEN